MRCVDACEQVPCKFDGGIVVRTDAFRPSGGGWARLLFRNVNGPSLTKAEVATSGNNEFK